MEYCLQFSYRKNLEPTKYINIPDKHRIPNLKKCGLFISDEKYLTPLETFTVKPMSMSLLFLFVYNWKTFIFHYRLPGLIP